MKRSIYSAKAFMNRHMIDYQNEIDGHYLTLYSLMHF